MCVEASITPLHTGRTHLDIDVTLYDNPKKEGASLTYREVAG